MRDRERLRRAKDGLRAFVEREPWFRGVGIAPKDGDLVLRLSVSRAADQSTLPHEFDGVPVDIVVIDGYEIHEP